MSDTYPSIETTRATILTLLAEEAPGLETESLKDDDALLSSGALDSMAIVNLVAALEQAFAVEFDTAELRAEHFETVGAMIAFVTEQQRAR